MEATRVEGHSGGLVARLALEVDLEGLRGVVPNIDLHMRSCNDQLLAQADIHTSDVLLVELRVDVLKLGLLAVRAVQSDIHFQQLVLAVDEVEQVLTLCKCHRLDLVLWQESIQVSVLIVAKFLLNHLEGSSVVQFHFICPDVTFLASTNDTSTERNDGLNAEKVG